MTALTPRPDPTPTAPTSAGPIALMVAMRSELRHLFPGLTLAAPAPGSADPALALLTADHRLDLVELPPPTRPPLAGTWPVWSGRIGAVPVVAVLSGIGPANAAGALGALLADGPVAGVISYGCAGAHHRDLDLGDVVIASTSVNHAAYDLLPDGSERYRGNAAATGPDAMPPSETPSDPRLLAAARAAAAGWAPTRWPGRDRDPAVRVGAVASADVWTQAVDRLDMLNARHGTLCEEMEAAALGVVCGRRGVPMLAIKDISNNEFHAVTDTGGGMAGFPLAEVGRRAAELVLRTVPRLGDGLPG